MKAFLAAIAVTLATAAAARGIVIHAEGAWSAIDRGNACEALSRSAKVVQRGRVQPVAGFTFTPDHHRWGEFHAQLSRVARSGSSIILKVGDQPFLLFGRGDWAWSRGAMQEQAIIAAVRQGGGMALEAHDVGGAQFVDPYALDGAPTAIDAAAARCALRGAGKIQ